MSQGRLVKILTIPLVAGVVGLVLTIILVAYPTLYSSRYYEGACELLTRTTIPTEQMARCPDSSEMFPCLQIQARFYKDYRTKTIRDGLISVDIRSLEAGCFTVECGGSTANNTLTVVEAWNEYRREFLSRDHFKCHGSPGRSTMLLSLEGVMNTPLVVGYVAVAVPGTLVFLLLGGLLWAVLRRRVGEKNGGGSVKDGEKEAAKATNV